MKIPIYFLFHVFITGALLLTAACSPAPGFTGLRAHPPPRRPAIPFHPPKRFPSAPRSPKPALPQHNRSNSRARKARRPPRFRRKKDRDLAGRGNPGSIPTTAPSSNPDFLAAEILGRPTNTRITANVVPARAMELYYEYRPPGECLHGADLYTERPSRRTSAGNAAGRLAGRHALLLPPALRAERRGW